MALLSLTLTRSFPGVLAALFLSLALQMPAVQAAPAGAVPKSIEWHEKARAAFRTGRFEEAAQATQQAITYDSYDPLLYITLGQSYQKLGQLDAAIQAFQRAAELNSRDASIYFSLGTLYEQKGDYPKALQAFDTSYLKNPNYAYVLSRKAQVLGFQKQYTDAIALYERYLNETPRDMEAHKQVARFAVASGDTGKAVSHLLYIKQQAPQQFTEEALLARAYLLQNRPQDALNELQQAEAKGRYSAEVADLKSRAHEQLGNVNAAIQELDVVAKQLPEGDDAEAGTYHYRLAALKAQNQQYGEALNHLNLYLKNNPNDVGARVAQINWLNRLGRFAEAGAAVQVLKASTLTLNAQQQRELDTQNAFSLLQVGQYNEAAGVYYKLLQGTPNSDAQYLTLLQNKALALYKANRYEDALYAFRQLLEAPQLTEAEKARVKQDMVSIYMAQGKNAAQANNLAQAEAFFQQAKDLAQTPEAIQQLQLELGALYYDTSRSAEAIAQYESVLQQAPYNLEARVNLARLVKQEQPQRAIELLLPVITDPAVEGDTYAMAQRLLSEAYVQTGKPTEAMTALKALETFTEKTPSSKAMEPSDAMQLGALYHQAGQYTQAESYYKKALKMQPVYPLAAYNLGSLYMLQKKYGPARTAMEQALLGEGAVPKAHYALGLLDENAKNHDGAYLHFQAYLQTAENLPEAERVALQQRLNGLAPKIKKETAVKLLQKPEASPASVTPEAPVKPTTTGGTLPVVPPSAAPQRQSTFGRIAL
jgi:tetratricopeptide (TPR) repeat protein